MVSNERSDQPQMPPNRYEQLVQSVVDYAIYMLDLSGTVVSRTQAPNVSRATVPRK